MTDKLVTFDSMFAESAIMGRLVIEMMENGFRVEFSDNDGGGLHMYAMKDGAEMRKPRDGYKHWVRLVPGNGVDVISDYTTNLEDVLKPVNELAEALRA